MCEYEGFGAYKWGSATDQTGRLPGLVCTKLEEPLPGSNLSTWHQWYKMAQLIEGVL